VPRTQGEDCAVRRKMQREIGGGQLNGESVLGERAEEHRRTATEADHLP